MNNIRLIEELTEICIQQAEIIKEQAFILEQLGAQSLEDEEISSRLNELVGETH